MPRKLTILFSFAVFVLVLGWAITPAQAHECVNHNRPDHPHCINGGVTDDISVRVFNSTDISVPQATDTILTFDSERWDTDDIHDTATDPSMLTA